MIRRPVPWPNGAKVAVAITFDMDADSILHLAHPKDSIARISAMSMMRYGPEVAVPRIVEAYRRYGIKQTFFVPAWCIEQYPKAVELMVKNGHEVAFHGYIHEAPNSLSRDEEHYWISRSVDVIKKHTGKRPRGARSPLYNFSFNTADLLIEEGFLYDASLMGDDVPYILKTKRGELVELPSHWALDDWPPYVHSLDLNYVMQIMAPERAMEIFMSEFEAMRQCGGGLWIGVWHPFVSGRLARWLSVERMIERMMKTGEVWFAPLEEIARHVQACRKKGSYKPRIDRLPYYDKPVGVAVPPSLTRAQASE
jgi:peptidoglycan/xylan/chitin deacetylase (PgdA/CDA1 family)